HADAPRFRVRNTAGGEGGFQFAIYNGQFSIWITLQVAPAPPFLPPVEENACRRPAFPREEHCRRRGWLPICNLQWSIFNLDYITGGPRPPLSPPCRGKRMPTPRVSA